MIQRFAALLVLNSETQVLQANSCGSGFFFLIYIKQMQVTKATIFQKLDHMHNLH